MIELVDLQQEEDSTTLRPALRFKRHQEKSLGNAAVKSGCMRGNDSTPVGVFADQEEPELVSYSDFINFNYGYVHERQHNTSARKKGK